MKVKVYPIKSPLHDQKVLDNSTSELLNHLNTDSIHISIENDIDKIYDGSDLTLILVQSGGSENLFLENFGKFKEPYYLLTYGTSNSLAASLEILAFLKNHHLKGEVLHGDNDYLISRIQHLVRKESSITPKYFLGVLGKPSDWLISSNVDEDVLLDKFQIKLIHISLLEVEKSYSDFSQKIEDDVFTKDSYPKEEITKAEKLYIALNQIITKYHLDGFTIRCFDLLSSLKTTACLALSKFNDQGIIASCEGDIPSLITMFIVKKLLSKTSFQANPARIDVKNNTILLTHCTIPLSLCSSFSLNSHFESNIGVGIHGEVKTGDITILRINSALNEYFIEEGKLLNNQYEKNLCRTQIVCTFPNLEKLLLSPLGNHEIIILGHYKKELANYLNNAGLKEI